MDIPGVNLHSIIAAAAARQNAPVKAPVSEPVATQETPEAQPTASLPVHGSLWDVLSPEERSFFEASGGVENLSYGPRRQPTASPSAPVGRHLDVKA